MSDTPEQPAQADQSDQTEQADKTDQTEQDGIERDADGVAIKRPTIEKVKAEEEIFIPEGHDRGEVMTFGQKVVYWATWLVSVGLGKAYFRLKVYGKENVPKTGAFIISPVHRSNLDSPALAPITTRRMRYMGKESLWKRKWSAWYFTAAGGFPVERATADREALKACIEVLDRGEPLVLFPEGTRQVGPVVTEMFDGPAWLACRAQVPILPIGIGGSAVAMGKGQKIPKPQKITVVVGRPVHPPAPGPRGRVSRRGVREMTLELRENLQVLFDEAQALAGTPNVHEAPKGEPEGSSGG